ncbi:MAG: SDR family NAD(P)-dependent oxidoreductase [Planctomycetota bacterium]|nr:SDR family NAD(P)-dependent oxidoreductase [Planctomycetota bacterium]
MKNWKGKTVVIAGGSRGLGLALAREFGNLGADLILLARGDAELQQVAKRLEKDAISVRTRSMDALDPESVEQAFAAIGQDSKIDVLVNAIGKSTRSDIENMDLDEAEALMDLNYFSALRCTRAALPKLLDSRGHLVNIGSLSSKTAWPFMTPYSASKFALAALTHQLRIELGDRLHAMLVCPGPIKREDAGQRYEEEATGLPDAAKQPGGGARLKGICPARLSRLIVRGCEKRKAELVVPWKANLLFIASSLSTRLGDWLLKKSGKSQ